MSVSIDDLKPGDQITCTVNRAIRREDDQQTVARMMRLDNDIKRKLKKAQEHRERTLVVRSRGKRPWAVRRKASKIAVPVQGASWTMTWTPLIKNDFKAVESLVDISRA